jgi:hypothetical protein
MHGQKTMKLPKNSFFFWLLSCRGAHKKTEVFFKRQFWWHKHRKNEKPALHGRRIEALSILRLPNVISHNLGGQIAKNETSGARGTHEGQQKRIQGVDAQTRGKDTTRKTSAQIGG